MPMKNVKLRMPTLAGGSAWLVLYWLTPTSCGSAMPLALLASATAWFAGWATILVRRRQAVTRSDRWYLAMSILLTTPAAFLVFSVLQNWWLRGILGTP